MLPILKPLNLRIDEILRYWRACSEALSAQLTFILKTESVPGITRSAASRGVGRAHASRFILIIIIFVCIQITVLAFGWAGFRMINATRAYATGESLYAKAANAAMLNLYRYADTGQES